MGKKRILIVDDEKAFAQLLKKNLELEADNYEFILAYNGQEALDKITNEKPDLILLDISLPDIDGLEVCKKIKGTPETKGIPVILITGKDVEAKYTSFAHNEFPQSGAVDFVTKPIDNPYLLNKIRIWIGE